MTADQPTHGSAPAGTPLGNGDADALADAAGRGGLAVYVLVGGRRYAVPVRHVHEVVRTWDMLPPPAPRHAVIGARIEGTDVIPVVDLGLLLDGNAEAEIGPLVIVRDDGRAAALAVQAVTGAGDVEGTGDRGAAPFLLGSARAGLVVLDVLDVPALLDATNGDG